MQLIIVLCLIAKLALVSGDCDVGKTVNDFDYNKFTGTWYYLYYLPNDDDDNVDGAVATFSVPDGIVSIITACAYDKREGRGVNFTGKVHDWDNTGFHFTTKSKWNGRMYIVAVDYDRYFITKFCYEESNTGITINMQLIIVLCLIAKLALDSGDCDVGKTVNDFDYNKFTGTWYVLYYQPNEDDDNVDGAVATFSVPDGNVSNITACAYDLTEGRGVNFTGKVHDWDNTGLHVTTELKWNGRVYIAAVDYDRYFFEKLCFEESNTVIIYVAFRSAHPDDATMKDVINASSANGIPFDNLKRWNGDRCLQ